MFFTIVSAFAQFERERIRERIGAAKADQRRRNRFLGGNRPFGYRVTDDGALVPDETEQGALSDMAALRSAQGEIQAALAAKGVHYPTRAPELTASSLRKCP